ncbi:ParB N-terminal domain-containing protein [Ursidibacter maritimus]|uniref:ParB family protein n=1 Tax=Ursidibacter maritimus TaxID=1331689 RepID=UPI001C459953|nr:ParB family protein [Ursidibacter maritimus]MBV6540770.1 ParB N-terminal domain-containing protein [Ursidibacter maritimus]
MKNNKNPLISHRSTEERRNNMREQLLKPAIQNISPSYNQTMPSMPTQKQLIVVTLDKLRPYEGNPRRTKNPAFDEIKASIKARGLDHAPNVTQRPGDDFYTIADGGNTRLQALKELFQETQDSRFWSIECVFKPWNGDIDDINSKLNILIGHLAENDIRGDLTFIEKALGIREVKKLYEEKYQEYFSHRKLAEKLGENGYPISHQIIARMEQCLTYLYPHIPNILLGGLGKAQIDKLVSIHNKAKISWEQHQVESSSHSSFDEIWMDTLSPFDENVGNFSISDLQDSLIGKMVEALNYQVSYDALKLEIDLEERKLQKLIEKQAEITQKAAECEQHIQEHHELLESKAVAKTQQPRQATSNEEHNPSSISVPAELHSIETMDEENIEHNNITNIHQEDQLPPLGIGNISAVEMENAITNHLAGFGIVPEAKRMEEAVTNALEFANTGRQPITNLWKIHPSRKHKMDAYSIALDIAEECGLAHLVQHIVYEPVDYSFDVLPLDISEPSPLQKTIHSLLSMLATNRVAIENNENHQCILSSDLLLGDLSHSAAISDLMLVRIFRLIRLVRHLKQESHQGGQNA